MLQKITDLKKKYKEAVEWVLNRTRILTLMLLSVSNGLQKFTKFWEGERGEFSLTERFIELRQPALCVVNTCCWLRKIVFSWPSSGIDTGENVQLGTPAATDNEDLVRPRTPATDGGDQAVLDTSLEHATVNDIWLAWRLPEFSSLNCRTV